MELLGILSIGVVVITLAVRSIITNERNISQAKLIEQYANAINIIRERKRLFEVSIELLREHAKSVESEWADLDGAADIEYAANELEKIVKTFDQNIPNK